MPPAVFSGQRRNSPDGVDVINAAAVALGPLTQAGPPPHIAELVGEEICTVARRIVEVCQRHGGDVSFLANQYSIQRSGCATTVIGTTKTAAP
jgi:L-galactose dehydrogenase